MMDRAVEQGVRGKKKRYPYLTVSKHGQPKRRIITFQGMAITNHYWAAVGGGEEHQSLQGCLSWTAGMANSLWIKICGKKAA